MSYCLVNGQSGDALAISDRGLRYGDGVFETLAVVDRKPRLWQEHIGRLTRGCQRLAIPVPDAHELWEDWGKLAPSADHGVLRLTITRGGGGVGYAPPINPLPSRIVEWLPAPQRPAEYWQEGIDIRVCRTHLAVQPALAGIKHLNRLEQVLARAECAQSGSVEGLMLATDGRLAEATSANILIESQGRLILPDTTDIGVDGIMQDWVSAQAKATGIPIERRAIRFDALRDDDSMMLCNSLIGLWPVRRVEGRQLPRPKFADKLLGIISQARVALTPEVSKS